MLTTCEIEVWAPVTIDGGYPGYEVSDLGRVRSFKSGAPKVLKPGTLSRGHLQVGLRREGQSQKKFLVHRLVLTSFVSPCPDKMECCHTDGDPSNNKLSNLRWDTHSANVQDAIRHGTSRRYLTDAHVEYIRSSTKTQRALAAELGVGLTTIHQIKSGIHYAQVH